eukprot:2396487-Prymnesium_polylepis.1
MAANDTATAAPGETAQVSASAAGSVVTAACQCPSKSSKYWPRGAGSQLHLPPTNRAASSEFGTCSE